MSQQDEKQEPLWQAFDLSSYRPHRPNRLILLWLKRVTKLNFSSPSETESSQRTLCHHILYITFASKKKSGISVFFKGQKVNLVPTTWVRTHAHVTSNWKFSVKNVSVVVALIKKSTFSWLVRIGCYKNNPGRRS